MAYSTVTDVRNFTNSREAEHGDTAVQQFIDRATQFIDTRTGRTWQNVMTKTDEYYDGNDTDTLWLNNSDIKSISSISIDQVGDNQTYTSVTASYVNYYDAGYIILNRSLAEVNVFKAGSKTVKITYTYGAMRNTAINDGDNIADDDTTITVDSTDGFPNTGTIKIDSEWIDYTGITSTTFTGCSRGAHGTTAAAHNDNTAVIEVPREIQDLCLLIVRNYMFEDPTRAKEIGLLINRLKRKTADLS